MAGGKIASKLLDMGLAARQARARKLGFDPDEVWHHGTLADFDEFDTSDKTLDFAGTPNNAGDNIGVFFAKNKNHSKYFGPSVGEYHLRMDNPRIFKTQDEWREFIREHNYQTPEVRDDEGFIVDEGRFHVGARKALEEAGHDSVLIERPGFTKTKKSDQPWAIALEPQKIRSTKAAFDPDKRSSSKLLDSILMPAAGTGIAASALLAPEEAEASFVGEGAQGIYKSIIAAARKMADSGIPREQIWRDTWDMGGGAYKGPDGKWRVEVDDSTLQMNPLLPDRAPESTRDTIPMGFDEAVRAPALVDAYPDLPGMRVSAKGNVSGGAYYAPSGDPFGKERVDLPMRSRGGRYANEDSSRSATAHELAHAIQQREGFSGGTNPGLARREYPKANGKDYTDEEAIELYMNNAGEAEARNVQARLSLTPDQRKAKFPWDTLDRPENDLWLSSHNGRNDSIRASDLPPLPTATQTIRHGFGRGADLGTITPMANPRMTGVANALDAVSERIAPPLRPFVPFLESGADWARKAAQGHTSWWDKLLVGMDAI